VAGTAQAFIAVWPLNRRLSPNLKIFIQAMMSKSFDEEYRILIKQVKICISIMKSSTIYLD
jgi:hypothetical protein